MIRSRRSWPALVVAGLAASACSDTPPAGEDGGPPSIEARLADWGAQPEGTSVPVALGFAAPLPDSVVAGLLERHNLRPYAVYTKAADLVIAHERERSRASLELLAEAREQTVQQMRTSLCAHQGRARAILDQADAGGADDELREVLSSFLGMRETLPRLELGEPLVYGVAAVGTLPDVQGARSDGALTSYEPGWRTMIDRADTVVLVEPPAPQGRPAALNPVVAALPSEMLMARAHELAETGMGSCEDASGSVEER